MRVIFYLDIYYMCCSLLLFVILFNFELLYNSIEERFRTHGTATKPYKTFQHTTTIPAVHLSI